MLQLILESTSGPLPTSTYGIFKDGIRVGMCQLRHRPSKSADMPLGFESHIYYEVESSHRGKGYATEALHQLLAEAKKLGLNEVFLTIEKNNAASLHVAKENDATQVISATGQDGRTYIRYKIAFGQ